MRRTSGLLEEVKRAKLAGLAPAMDVQAMPGALELRNVRVSRAPSTSYSGSQAMSWANTR